MKNTFWAIIKAKSWQKHREKTKRISETKIIVCLWSDANYDLGLDFVVMRERD